MLPRTRLEKLPRMADFALWVTACETALWPAGTFWSAYCGNLSEAVEGVIDADPIAMSVRALVGTQTEWTGTATDLLGALVEAAGERAAKSKTWPDSPRALAGRLRRAATFLRKIGIEVAFEREGRARTRIIRITTARGSPALGTKGSGPSAWSVPPSSLPEIHASDGSAVARTRTVARCADDADAIQPAQSGPENLGVSGRTTATADFSAAIQK